MELKGWISIHRKILDNFLFKENRSLSRAEAWLYILLLVNHEKSETVIIKNKILTCNRGESLRSLETWAKVFNWDKSKVKRFFDLLKGCNMIELKDEQITTRLIVCNYDTYQVDRNKDETSLKQSRNKFETSLNPNNNNNNDNNKNNDIENKKEIFKEKMKKILNDWKDSTDLKIKAKFNFFSKNNFDPCKEFCDYWFETSKSGKMRYECEKFFDMTKRLNTWFKFSNNQKPTETQKYFN